jgi:hypothetical protein
MTRDDFIAAVSAKRGQPDDVEHSLGGLAIRYGNAFITANDREIGLNDGASFDRMVAVRLSQARGRR